MRKILHTLMLLTLMLVFPATAFAASGFTMSYLPGTTDTVTNLPAEDSGTNGTAYTVSSTVPVRDGYEFIDWELHYEVVNPEVTAPILNKYISEEDVLKKTQDAAFGDTIHYVTKVTMPDYGMEDGNYTAAQLNSLSCVITDIPDGGITYTDGTLVIDGLEAGDYTAAFADGKLTITLSPEAIVKSQGKELAISYDSILNKTAVVNSTAGNAFPVTMTYTENPWENDTTGELSDDVRVFSYAIVIKTFDYITKEKPLSEVVYSIKASDVDVVRYDYIDGDFYADNEGDKPQVYLDYKDIVIKGIDAGTYKTAQDSIGPNKDVYPGREVNINDYYVPFVVNGVSNDGELTGDAYITSRFLMFGEILPSESDTRIIEDGSSDLVIRFYNRFTILE